MLDLSALDNLPDISILEEEEISLQGMLDDMVNDFEVYYENKNGEEITLYPGDDRRIELEVTAGKLYQLANIIDANYRFNFIKWMYGGRLKNWGANFGFLDDGTEYAITTLQFTLSAVQETDITVPAGTRATAGDNVFFATDEDLVIEAGEESGIVSATCTETGVLGNGYVAGQLNIIVDPVNLVASVSNTIASSGGHDEYTDDELKEEIFNYTDSYSTSGPESGYEAQVLKYSPLIADAKTICNKAGQVNIYAVLQDGVLPSQTFREAIYDYLIKKASHPDTDQIIINAPDAVPYNLTVSYYIPASLADNESDIIQAVSDAADAFVKDNAENIGKDIDPGVFLSYAMAAGAGRVVVSSPAFTEIGEDEVGICENIDITYNGLV